MATMKVLVLALLVAVASANRCVELDGECREGNDCKQPNAYQYSGLCPGRTTKCCLTLKYPNFQMPAHTGANANSVAVDKDGLDAIVGYEIGSESYYKRHAAHLIWPKGASGITIGVGIDFGYTAPNSVQEMFGQYIGKDPPANDRAGYRWGGKKLTQAHLDAWKGGYRKRGSAGQAYLNQLKRRPEIYQYSFPLSWAKHLFFQYHVPEYIHKMWNAYGAGLRRLPPAAQGMMLSLTFNRGGKLSGARRAELNDMKKALDDQSLGTEQLLIRIAERNLKSRRLWQGRGVDGLLARRLHEAQIMRNAISLLKKNHIQAHASDGAHLPAASHPWNIDAPKPATPTNSGSGSGSGSGSTSTPLGSTKAAITRAVAFALPQGYTPAGRDWDEIYADVPQPDASDSDKAFAVASAAPTGASTVGSNGVMTPLQWRLPAFYSLTSITP